MLGMPVNLSNGIFADKNQQSNLHAQQVSGHPSWLLGRSCMGVELWVISLLEIGHIFPLIVVDIKELSYLCRSKIQSIGFVTAIVDGESQLSKEAMNYDL